MRLLPGASTRANKDRASHLATPPSHGRRTLLFNYSLALFFLHLVNQDMNGTNRVFLPYIPVISSLVNRSHTFLSRSPLVRFLSRRGAPSLATGEVRQDIDVDYL